MNMSDLMYNKLFNILLLLTILGEFILPWILKRFYKGYNSKTMVMSALGSPESPVRWIYNIWLVWLGVFLLFTSVLMFLKVSVISNTLAILTLISIATFAVGAGLLAGLFSVNELKDKVTVASQIHGAGSAIGFMTLLFFPLLQSITAFAGNDYVEGIICAIAFVLAMLFFVFFVMGDKESFKGTVFSYEGLWERLSLFFMYAPFLHTSIEHLLLA